MSWVTPTFAALALCSAPAQPAAAEADAPAEGSVTHAAPDAVEPPAEERARASYLEGLEAYETADYARAIESFEAALRSASDIEDPERRENAVASLQYNIARTHVRAHDLDGEPRHLRIALTLLDQYAARVDDDERASAEALRRDVQGRLARERTPPRSTPPPAREARREVQPLTVGGALLLSLAGVGAGAMVGGLVSGARAVDDYRDGPTRDDRDEAVRRGRIGNGLAIGGAVAAAALAVAGTVLVIVGQRRKSARARLASRIGPSAGLLGGTP